MDSTPEWKTERLDHLKETIQFFGNARKLEREKWVVAQLLQSIGITYNENELVKGEEPADVVFREAHFQVKEVLDVNRRRGDEYKAELNKVEKARKLGELLEHYSPNSIEWSDIVRECCDYSEALLYKYGPNEKVQTDLLCYYNKKDSIVKTSETRNNLIHHFRSLSIVSNSFRGIIYAQLDAPDFLCKNQGRVWTYDPFE